MSVFDKYQTAAFDHVTNIMGDAAVWHKDSGDVEGEVLFKDPNKMLKLGEFEFNPLNHTMEYRAGVFEGLYELTRAQDTQEVTVKDQRYYVRDVKAEFDGQTFIAHLEVKE